MDLTFEMIIDSNVRRRNAAHKVISFIRPRIRVLFSGIYTFAYSLYKYEYTLYRLYAKLQAEYKRLKRYSAPYRDQFFTFASLNE